MRRRNISARCLALLGAAAAFSFMTLATRAQGRAAFPALVLKKADPAEKAEGTLGPAAKEAIEHGPLPFSDADVVAKAEANRARDEAEKKGPCRRTSRPCCAQKSEVAQQGYLRQESAQRR